MANGTQWAVRLFRGIISGIYPALRTEGAASVFGTPVSYPHTSDNVHDGLALVLKAQTGWSTFHSLL